MGRQPVELKAHPLVTELLEELKLRRTSGLGRWLFSLMTLGSVVDPSSLRTTSSLLPILLREISSQSQDGECPQTPPEVSPLSSEWFQTFPLSPTVIAMTFTELSDPELSALTPLEERDLAMEIL